MFGRLFLLSPGCPLPYRCKCTGLNEKEQVLEYAQKAKEAGSTRFCMGAAWREVRDNRDFDRVLDMVKGVNEMGMEVCCTLGMLTENQAQKLADAGLYAYNHNLDTSSEYYGEIITTRTYDDRLQTLDNVRKAGVSVCCGGIVGLGETHEDRVKMLYTLATMPQHPESVPVNALVPVKGRPWSTIPR
ncbi:radical SAM protein [Paraflavitalea speifideaquila]|uniref:radical SAM protein n=1 Tax=Paraflavitalea speifideaquila TaxID=3076558 RepID=UPI0028F15BE0|nr:radical SAM protein [Paraflavitalea speifideiaquila]